MSQRARSTSQRSSTAALRSWPPSSDSSSSARAAARAQCDEGGKHESGLVDEAARPARRPGAVALGLPLEEEEEAERERVVERTAAPE